jgi:hypothetical protein
MSTGNLDDPPGEDIAPHRCDPKDPAFRAVHAAEQFLSCAEALSPARLAELEGLLKDLAAVPWEDATPEGREAGWGLTLRLTLLKGPERAVTAPLHPDHRR